MSSIFSLGAYRLIMFFSWTFR